MRIGILSDTHDLLRPEVLDRLRGCDAILHAGDFSSRRILDRLAQFAPVRAVRGNTDRAWAEDLTLSLDLTLAGLKIFITHKKKDLPGDLSPWDLAVFGHSHQYFSDWVTSAEGRRTLLLNPGSCGPRRFRLPVTLAMLTIGEAGWNAERIDITAAAGEPAPDLSGSDIRRQIETVIRETEKGRTVEAIARKHGMEPTLVEQIARLYVTHPGVSADGIMTKMGL